MERKRELDLYYASEEDFKRAFDASIMRLLAQNPESVLQRQVE